MTFVNRPKRKATSSTVEKVPIVEILEHYGAERVPLTVRGWAAMRCPFHDDTAASASVNTAEGAFKCHACGVKGDGISLVREHERCEDFASAVSAVEGILGRSLNGIRGTTEKRNKRVGLFDDDARPVSGQASIFSTRLR